MSKKLIICSPQLGISSESNSGGEVYDREVIKSLCQQGLKVIVILPRNKPYIPHKNLKVYYLPLPFFWPSYLFNLFIIPYLFFIHKKEKFNILRVHSPYFVGLGTLIFKLFQPRIPLVTTYHHLEEKKSFFDLINRLSINKWDQIIADSQFTKKEILQKYKIDKSKIQVVYLGVGEKFKPMEKKENLVKKHNLKNKKVLLFLGGLKVRKNVDFLLRLVSKLDWENIKLLVVGRGGLYKQLVKTAKRLAIEDKVIFTGFVPEKQKTDFYNLADLFLFPSQKEGFGMPVIEVGACGVPSIASNVSSLKELVINGKTGYLAKFNDINDWKNKIEELLSNESLRKKMGQKAQKFSQNFSWDKTAKKQIAIYKRLI